MSWEKYLDRIIRANPRLGSPAASMRISVETFLVAIEKAYREGYNDSPERTADAAGVYSRRVPCEPLSEEEKALGMKTQDVPPPGKCRVHDWDQRERKCTKCGVTIKEVLGRSPLYLK
jgi:hypothetical protein